MAEVIDKRAVLDAERQLAQLRQQRHAVWGQYDRLTGDIRMLEKTLLDQRREYFASMDVRVGDRVVVGPSWVCIDKSATRVGACEVLIQWTGSAGVSARIVDISCVSAIAGGALTTTAFGVAMPLIGTSLTAESEDDFEWLEVGAVITHYRFKDGVL